MKLLTTFLLVGLLALWMGFPTTTGSDLPTDKQSPEKPGECPIDTCRCIPPTIYICRTDKECKGRMKCCENCCVKKCVDPRVPG
ncbi:PREDICTED: scuwaprin-a-like [Thamnophis sirtalis]|uniref:Scuwaprin-a-like n=1 Tax=Thamnophis sirtalis TaxID=35019 RepID=A0A6I9XQ28_9SAUR|nr:PREDICTED: scuwaprin-a-like [Thamnophis sirtalis]